MKNCTAIFFLSALLALRANSQNVIIEGTVVSANQEKIEYKNYWAELRSDDSVLLEKQRINTAGNFTFQLNFAHDYFISVLTKTETTTTFNALLDINGYRSKIKLFDKKNWWWYDSSYQLVKNNKWFDNDKFGLFYKPYDWSVWYSIKEAKITFNKDGVLSNQMDIDKLFTF